MDFSSTCTAQFLIRAKSIQQTVQRSSASKYCMRALLRAVIFVYDWIMR